MYPKTQVVQLSGFGQRDHTPAVDPAERGSRNPSAFSERNLSAMSGL